LAKDTLGHWADSTVVRSLRRHMDALLPPWTIALDVDIEMNPVTDPLLKEILSRPYSTREDELGRRDFNLGNRRNALYELIGFNELAGSCRLAKDTSERLLLNSTQFHEWADTSTRQAMRTLTIDRERLAQRKDAISRETNKLDPSLEQDIRVNEAITHAIASPSIRLDAIGLFVVSNTKPQMVELGENEEDM
jgi:ATP-dependent helicase HepA